MITRLTSLLIFLLALTTSLSVKADSITVAVASNFTAPANDLATAFEKETGHSVRLTFGSSGKLLAQVTHGAPFDVFLSADQAKPLKLEEESLAVPGTRFTYALGTLALWTASDTPARDILMENIPGSHSPTHGLLHMVKPPCRCCRRSVSQRPASRKL